MTVKRSAAIDAAKETIVALGGSVLDVDYTHKHPRVNFTLPNGETKFYVCSATPSDRRIGGNIRSDLRHIFGVVKSAKTAGTRRPKRAPPVKAAAPSFPDAITAGADPFAVLRLHPQAETVNRVDYDRAWRGFWASCMSAVGGRSVIA